MGDIKIAVESLEKMFHHYGFYQSFMSTRAHLCYFHFVAPMPILHSVPSVSACESSQRVLQILSFHIIRSYFFSFVRSARSRLAVAIFRIYELPPLAHQFAVFQLIILIDTRASFSLCALSQRRSKDLSIYHLIYVECLFRTVHTHACSFVVCVYLQIIKHIQLYNYPSLFIIIISRCEK